jgi:excisionase family DNA binding protein
MIRTRLGDAEIGLPPPDARTQAGTSHQRSLYDPADAGRHAEGGLGRTCAVARGLPVRRSSVSGLPLEETLDSCSHLLTVRELASLLSIAEKTIYGYVSRGLIPYVKIQSNLRFRPRAIAKWLATREFEPGARGLSR